MSRRGNPGLSSPSTSRALLDDLARFADSRGGPLAIFLWAFAEAVALPVIPDVLLGLLLLAAPRRFLILFVSLCLGSLAGSLLLYALTTADPETVRQGLLALPGINQPMVTAASGTVASGSPICLLLFGPGTPLKVFTFAWASGAISPIGLLPAVILNRVSRIAPLALAQVGLGLVAPDFLRRHERIVLGLYGAAYLATYALYLA
jgi:membrane protein YqaA with SNARE-associated domain